MFNFINITLYINSSTIRNNSAIGSTYCGIFISQSVLYIFSSIFSDQTSTSVAGFLYIQLNSNVSIISSTFSKGSAIYGGAIWVDKSYLSVTSSLFTDNTGSSNGGSIFGIDSSIFINTTNITRGSSQYGDAIYMINNNLKIYSSHFSYSKSMSNLPTSSIVISGNGNVVVINTIFSNSINYVSGLFARGLSSVYISNSRFESINSLEIGALTLIGDINYGNAIISQSIFINNNSTGNGTAINLNDMSIVIQDSIIEQNHANIDGGGLYLASPLCNNCTFNIKGTTRIMYNSCGRNGGAMVWYDYLPNIDNPQLIANNTAAYGGNFASVPAGLMTPNSRMLIPTKGFMINEAPPGQIYKGFLLISLVDTYNNVITTDSTSILMLDTNNNSPNLSLSGNLTFTANKGVFNITGFVPSAPPGSYQFFNASTSSIVKSGQRNDNTNYQDTIIIDISLRNCTYGEAIGGTQCVPCPEFKFLIEPATSCLACPTGGICPGKDQLLPLPGYWRSTNLSAIIYPCRASSACLGNMTKTNYNGTCGTGYTSVKCSSCLGGYSLTSQGYCNNCPSQAQNGFILTLTVIAFIIISIILVKASIKAAFAPSKKHSIYIKIFTNYLQLVFLTSQFNLKWPSYVSSMFGIHQAVASSTDSLVSFDCYVATKTSGDPVDGYYYKLVFYAVLPFIIFFASFLVWLGMSFYKMNTKYLSEQLPLTMIVIFFLVYPTIVKFMFSNFACEDIDQLGKYLIANPAINCSESRYESYSYIVAIPSIILWAVGLPTLVLIIMTKRKRFLTYTNNKIVFGFLFNGYRMSRFFWEFVIMYRKIFMISIAVFFNQVSAAIQGLTIVLIIIISLFMQYEFKPFNSSELNHLELESLMTATLTLYCGLYYLDGIDKTLELILFLIIAAGNIFFCVLWLYWMMSAISDMVAKIFPHLQFYCKKGDAYQEEFYSEELRLKGTVFNNEEGARIYTFLDQTEEKDPGIKITDMDQLYLEMLEKSGDNTEAGSLINTKKSTDLELKSKNTLIENEEFNEDETLNEIKENETESHDEEPESFAFHEKAERKASQKVSIRLTSENSENDSFNRMTTMKDNQK